MLANPRTLAPATGIFIATVAAVGALWFFLHHGVNLLDESIGPAIAHRFLQGDRPFRDEHSLLQISSLFIYPLVRAFELFTGGMDGLMLFLRKSYFIMMLLVTATVYLSLSKGIDKSTAYLSSLLLLVVVPWATPSLTYKSIPAALFTVGIFLGHQGVEARQKKVQAIAACFLAMAGIINPPFLVAGLGLVVALVFYRSSKTLIPLLAFFAAVLTLLAVLAQLGLFTGYESMMAFHHNSKRDFTRLGTQVWTTVAQLLLQNLPKKITLSVGISLLCFRARRSTAARNALILLPVALFWNGLGPMGGFTYFCASAPFFYLALQERKAYGNLLIWIWLPSIANGCLAAAGSDVTINNMHIGLWPAGVISCVGLLLAVGQPIVAGSARRSGPTFAAFACAMLLSATVLTQPFTDEAIWEVAARVNEGPYRGLYTNSARKKCLIQLQQDLNLLANAKGKIHVTGGRAPFVYLMSTMRQASPSPWMCSAKIPLCRSAMESLAGPEDLVVQVHPEVCKGPRSHAWTEANPSRPLVPSTGQMAFEPVIERPQYRLLRLGAPHPRLSLW